MTGDAEREGSREGRAEPVEGSAADAAAGAAQPDEAGAADVRPGGAHRHEDAVPADRPVPAEHPVHADRPEHPVHADPLEHPVEPPVEQPVEQPARVEHAARAEDPEPPRGDRPGRDPAEIDVESAFAAIVAGYGAPPGIGVGPWPAAEDVDTDEDRRQDTARDLPDEPDPRPVAPVAAGARRIIPGEPVEEDDEPVDVEGYVPPEPPPLPRGDLVSRLAWAGVLGGPVFLLLAALVWKDLPAVLLLGALGAFVGGFVTLVARLPGTPPDDPDDGAVV